MRSSLLLCLALAASASVGAAEGCAVEPEAAVRAVNALRAEGRRCGPRWWPAAPALRWQAQLAESTRRYAEELAQHDRLDHVGEGGANLRTRLLEAGYAMRVAGENLSGGPQALDEALADWLASPPHCENLMAPDFEEFGLACVGGPGRLQRYWVLQLAAPRSSPGRSP
ncbi:CAP domain-containing protein [Roseateles sp.]|uniref:CAP domain-containing protein n=1 Tax=Roseateles sp. TaxID=1971397 RepID=UPI002E0492D0|nr:CAP domain-containing protein [Roseateles sp.]